MRTEILYHDVSLHDGQQLPWEWRKQNLVQRGLVFDCLKPRTKVDRNVQAPAWWHMMTSNDRYAVIKHLKAGGLLPTTHPAFRAVDRMMWTGYPVKGEGKSTFGRVLPWRYTRLHQTWVRSNGQYAVPVDMNDGHLDNTIKLLIESHGNALSKAEAMLGAISRYFPRERVVELCAELANLLQTTEEVDVVYPIFGALVREQKRRETAEPVAKDPITEAMNDTWDKYL